MAKKIKVAPAKRTGPKNYWQDPVELPRNHPSVLQRRVGLERFNYWLMRFSPLLVALSLIFFFLGVAANNSKDTEVAAPVVINSPTKALAITTLEAWLAGANSALPNGQFVAWNGVSTMAKPVLSESNVDQDAEQPTVEIHTMSVAGKDGRLYTSEVQIATLASAGSKVVGSPSLIPVATNANQSIGDINPWPAAKQISIDANATQAAKTWATAFLFNDPAALKQTLGDPSPDNYYLPLYGATMKSVEVTAAGTMDFDPKKPEKVSETSLVRVLVYLTWDGQTSDKATTPFITFDLLLNKADTATPVVVAWGGPGSGPTLVPFGNAQNRAAIIPEDLAQQTKGTQAPSPATTPATVKK